MIEQPSVTTYQDNLATACELLGYALTKLGQHREAQEALKEARTMYHRLIQSNSENAGFKKSLLEVETTLAESEKAREPTLPGSTVTRSRQ